MKKLLFAVRDDKMAVFDTVITMDNVAVATRAFGDAIANADARAPLAAHREDFSLWCIGEYDVSTGKISAPKEGAYIVARGSDFSEKE